jgi:hypothetical protein
LLGGDAVRTRPELIPYAALRPELDPAVGLRLSLSERCVRGKDLPGMAFEIPLKPRPSCLTISCSEGVPWAMGPLASAGLEPFPDLEPLLPLERWRCNINEWSAWLLRIAEIIIGNLRHEVILRIWNSLQRCSKCRPFYRRPSRSFRHRSLKGCPRRRRCCWKRLILRPNTNAEIVVSS